MWSIKEKTPSMDAEQLHWVVQSQPDYLRTLTAPLIIKGKCILNESPITHLSPHVIFENCVEIHRCLHLETAEGTFLAPVSFKESKIRRIGELIVDIRKTPNKEKAQWSMNKKVRAWKPAACFRGCKDLKQARGTYLGGGVDFSSSGIKEILSQELRVEADPKKGGESSFHECFLLKVARGTFPGPVDFSGSWGLEKIDTHPETGLRILGTNYMGDAANFSLCKNLHTADGYFPGNVNFNASGIKQAAKSLKVATGSKARFGECYNLVDIPAGKLQDPQWEIDPDTARQIREHEHARERARATLTSKATFEL